MKKLLLFFIAIWSAQLICAEDLLSVKGYRLQNAYFADTVKKIGFVKQNSSKLYSQEFSTKHCGECYMNDRVFNAFLEGEWYLDAVIDKLSSYKYNETKNEVEIAYDVRIIFRSMLDVKGTLSFIYNKGKYEVPMAIMVSASSADPNFLKLTKQETMTFSYQKLAVNTNPIRMNTLEDEIMEWHTYDIKKKYGCVLDKQIGAIHFSDISVLTDLKKKTAAVDSISRSVKIGIDTAGIAIDWSLFIKDHKIYYNNFVYDTKRHWDLKQRVKYNADKKYCSFELINKQVPGYYYSDFEYKEVVIERYPTMKALILYGGDPYNYNAPKHYFYDGGNAKKIIKDYPFNLTTEQIVHDFSECQKYIGFNTYSYKVELYYVKVKLILQEVDNPQNFIEAEYIKPIIAKMEKK